MFWGRFWKFGQRRRRDKRRIAFLVRFQDEGWLLACLNKIQVLIGNNSFNYFSKENLNSHNFISNKFNSLNVNIESFQIIYWSNILWTNILSINKYFIKSEFVLRSIKLNFQCIIFMRRKIYGIFIIGMSVPFKRSIYLKWQLSTTKEFFLGIWICIVSCLCIWFA